MSAVSTVKCAVAEAGRRTLRYRLVLVAADPVEAVSRAGGWLFDRAVSGWDVTVVVDDPADIRPLTILGVGVLDLGCVLRCRQQVALPQAFAVAGDPSALPPAAHDWVYRYITGARGDVRFWGETGDAEIGVAQAAPTHYLPSRAARAFKAYALEAVGIRPAETETESFRAAVRALG